VSPVVDWLSAATAASVVAAVVSALAALWAIQVARDANRRADDAVEAARVANALAAEGNTLAKEANRHSEEARDAAKGANTISERALHLQEDQTRLRLTIEPRIATGVTTEKPQALLTVINLSSFPVTIASVRCRTSLNGGSTLAWLRTIGINPRRELPIRIEPRDSLTLLGPDEIVEDLELLAAIESFAVLTSCGEEIEVLTDAWKADSARILARRSVATP